MDGVGDSGRARRWWRRRRRRAGETEREEVGIFFFFEEGAEKKEGVHGNVKEARGEGVVALLPRSENPG